MNIGALVQIYKHCRINKIKIKNFTKKVFLHPKLHFSCVCGSELLDASRVKKVKKKLFFPTCGRAINAIVRYFQDATVRFGLQQRHVKCTVCKFETNQTKTISMSEIKSNESLGERVNVDARKLHVRFSTAARRGGVSHQHYRLVTLILCAGNIAR